MAETVISVGSEQCWAKQKWPDGGDGVAPLGRCFYVLYFAVSAGQSGQWEQ